MMIIINQFLKGAVLVWVFVLFAGCNLGSSKTQLAELTMSHGFANKLSEYFEQYGRYPNQKEGLRVLFEEGLIDEEKLKDPWGNPYIYRFPSHLKNRVYDIVCLWSDGVVSDDDLVFSKKR